jgi:hypothetical protein
MDQAQQRACSWAQTERSDAGTGGVHPVGITRALGDCQTEDTQARRTDMDGFLSPRRQRQRALVALLPSLPRW